MSEASRQTRVLVVDDDPFALKVVGSQLARLGFGDVIACRQARDAIEQLESDPAHPVGLVISDLQMPEMDGIEFVRHLVARGYSGNLLLLSGEDDRTVQAAARLAWSQRLRLLGAMSKPVELESLRQRLDCAVPSSAAPRPPCKSYSADEIERAIVQGELINHYQPKVALSDGTPVGVECLVRWQHPRDGMVFPDQFITVAEENGLVDALTRAVLVQALHQTARWRASGLALKVAVNVSMENLCALDFPDVVVQGLDDAGAHPQDLILEVTESRLMQNRVAALDILTRLRLKRVTLSIDDFGTGHSSLAQLRDLPFDEIKLDRSFVHGVGDEPQRRAIVEASIAMARQLGMSTVAEGVEDRDDWEAMRELGCDLVQGYFCAKPMGPADLGDWMTGWEAARRTLVAAA